MTFWRKGLAASVAVAAGMVLVSAPADAAPRKRPALPGDVNGDGQADVIAGAHLLKAGGRSDAGGVVVWFGGGKVSAKAWIATASKPVAKENLGRVLTTADFDRDGYSDVIASGRKKLVIFRGSSAGLKYSKSFAWPITNAPMKAADFDGDGYGDVAVRGNKEIVVFEGGSKGLTKSGTLKNGAAEFGAVLAVGDFTGDKRPDLLATDFRPAHPEPVGPQRVSIVPGAAGGLSMSRALAFLPARPDVFDMAVGDLSGDGKGDVVLATGDQVIVHRSRGVTVETPQILSFSDFPGNLAIGDLVGDGRADLAVHVAADNHDWVEIYKGTAGGVTAKPVRTLKKESYETRFGADMAISNVTGDKRLDLVAGVPGVYGVGQVHVLPNGGYTGLQRLKLGTTGANGLGFSLP
ncbi:VCBS repeat-containing protein [Herbidospora sp. NBRC 101105]|uniref:FG-GAP repeat domain-containing protein n=1 Tax=Herbidospora sp. NBRC 101105 TaxID=3032195 RepID=UPI0025569D70|nr:VCBS repeat-containing protein [Herbidospora sp. NBRC 101105]